MLYAVLKFHGDDYHIYDAMVAAVFKSFADAKQYAAFINRFIEMSDDDMEWYSAQREGFGLGVEPAKYCNLHSQYFDPEYVAHRLNSKL